MDSVVPLAPAGVCFKKEDFTKANFSADVFLQDLWNSVTLEILRDDLGSYLKVLRSSMIELINRDYADFVNLSGNLVGLDKAIIHLEEPLSVIHSEILMVAKVLDEVYYKLQLSLSERQNLREKRIVLESLMKIPASLEHLELLIANITNSESIFKMVEDDQTKGCIMERTANELNHIQHLLAKCRSSPFSLLEFEKRIEKVNMELMRCLEDALLFGVQHNKNNVLQKTLRTYFLLDQCKAAINVLRIRLIHPAFAEILNHNSLKKDPQDLNGLLLKIKDFIRQKMKHLLEISGSFGGPRGLNLVLDGLWSEFYDSLTCNLDCIFAQGNPDLFHKRYSCTMEFVNYLESLLHTTSLKSSALTNDPNYQLLITRWNLPVYFQMRYQELAGELETSLLNQFSELEPSDGSVYFNSTHTLLTLLRSCFVSDIYLSPLAHRFWKLCLQLMSRYEKKSIENLLEQSKRYESALAGNPPGATVSQSSSSAKLSDLDAPLLSHPSALSLIQLVMWITDIRYILSQLQDVWSCAWKQLGTICPKNKNILESAFKCSVSGFENLLPKMNELIVIELSTQCTAHLRNVADIPRLYRRTNKETPTKCSTYVHQVLEPLRNFYKKHSNQRELPSWTKGVLEALVPQYLVAVSDVLTSVQKTEESLKRLRKDRVASSSAGISDNDKIRMQLIIDVDAFVKEAQSFLGNDIQLPKLKALLDVVEPARLVFHTSST